jgi:hypothetical protein
LTREGGYGLINEANSCGGLETPYFSGSLREGEAKVPCGQKRKLKKIATHKRKKKKRNNRHKTR